MPNPPSVSLISRWFLRPGCYEQAMPVLAQLARDVRAHEPDTLTYLVHVHGQDDPRLQPLPPADPLSILFFETYRDADAFVAHVEGPDFTNFVRDHGALFVAGADGKPYTTVEFLTRHAGFTRSAEPAATDEGAASGAVNRHPAVMFEIIANDQARMKAFYGQVFGWRYQAGQDGFAYVHFAGSAPPLLGGIGQTIPDLPGMEPGHAFYLLVDRLEPAIAAAVAAGGQEHMPPAAVDGYRFAMISDPEGNPVGLVEPFGA
jgi:uncharacterized protein